MVHLTSCPSTTRSRLISGYLLSLWQRERERERPFDGGAVAFRSASTACRGPATWASDAGVGDDVVGGRRSTPRICLSLSLSLRFSPRLSTTTSSSRKLVLSRDTFSPSSAFLFSVVFLMGRPFFRGKMTCRRVPRWILRRWKENWTPGSVQRWIAYRVQLKVLRTKVFLP